MIAALAGSGISVTYTPVGDKNQTYRQSWKMQAGL